MAKIIVNNENKKSTIAPEIYGHFSEHLGRCIYEGLFVGENSDIPNVNGMRTDVVDALKEMKIPVLRWPGGCFADEYHWMDGIGPKEKRKKMINTHWGGVVEDNSFGTHEFFELCRQLGCKTYVNGNLGSGTVREMSEWVENKVDLTKTRNLIITGVIFVCGLGFGDGLTFTVAGTSITLTALSIAAIAGILLNIILPGNDYEFDESSDL